MSSELRDQIVVGSEIVDSYVNSPNSEHATEREAYEYLFSVLTGLGWDTEGAEKLCKYVMEYRNTPQRGDDPL